VARGVFEFEPGKKDDQFNLKPRDDRAGAIPEEQRKIGIEVYEARNILKLLQEQGAFKNDDTAYTEFISRILQAAEGGCVSANVDTTLAAAALEQIRADIVRRKGRHIIYRYLLRLGLWALAGGGIAFIAIAAAKFWPGLEGYGWVVIGAMAGAWLSVAGGRREVSFDAIPDFFNYGYEPPIRMVFVGILAAAFALFLQLKILSVTIAGFDLAKFPTDIGWALALGLVAGVGERVLSVQLIARAHDVLSPSKRSAYRGCVGTRGREGRRVRPTRRRGPARIARGKRIATPCSSQNVQDGMILDVRSCIINAFGAVG
jgi:hypothetical protein